MPDTGNSATVTFGTTGFTARYTGIGQTEQTIPDINKSALATTEFEEYMPGDLTEPGEFECEFQYDPNLRPSVGTVETITITYPVPAGLTNGATMSGTGYIKKRVLPELKNNTLMLGKLGVKWDGVTGPTFTNAT